VRRVQLAELGSHVTVPVSAEQLADAVEECARVIDQNLELLDSLDEADAGDVLACQKAAERLAERLRAQPHDDSSASPLVSWPNEAPGISVPSLNGPITIRRLREPDPVAGA
jgi:hypothetical protein